MGNEVSKQNDTLIAALIALDVLNEYDFDREIAPKRKRGNEHRDRERAVNFIDSWTDEMFRRQFRLKRETFNELLQKIETQFPISEKSRRMAINSSGSFISNKLRLCVCLRMLAGASYLDMIWYGVNVDHVTEYFLDMVKKIDIVIDNIKLPETKAEIELTAKVWADIQNKKHHGFNPMPNTLFAGDGLVLEIRCPSRKELANMRLSLDAFRNRKGFFGLIAQAFCDAHGRFVFWEISWPGATNDLTAYKQTELFRIWRDTDRYKGYQMVLDAIYSSIGGAHLTPYSARQLRRAKDRGDYGEYRLFNSVLSAQRVTIERAFGMLVRRWGILWKAMEYKVADVKRIARVCAKLHNMCMDDFILGKAAKITIDPLPHGQDGANLFSSAPSVEDTTEDDFPVDAAVVDQFNNLFIDADYAASRPAGCPLRNELRKRMFDHGLRFSSSVEDCFEHC